jgi:hypothetical protein
MFSLSGEVSWTAHEHEPGIRLDAGKCNSIDIVDLIITDAKQSIKSSIIADGDRLIDYQCPFLPIGSLRLLKVQGLPSYADHGILH